MIAAFLHLTIEQVIWAALLATVATIVFLDHPWQRSRSSVLEGRDVEAVAGTGQVPYGAANRDEATAYDWKRRGASGRVQLKNEASPHAYSTSRPSSTRAGERTGSGETAVLAGTDSRWDTA